MPSRVVENGRLIDWDGLPKKKLHIRCPECGKPGKRADKTCGVTIEGDRGIAHCFRCEFVAVRGGAYRPGDATSRIVADKPQHATLSEFWRDMWRNSRAISGLALQYLQARDCVIPPPDGDLRWHQQVKHPSGYVGPALIGRVTDANTGEPISLHRTWIRSDGTKPVEPARMLAPGHRKQGGVIRLWPDDAVTTGLGIAEGTETALSLAHGITPVWASIDAANLAAFAVLDGIEALTIAADHDAAGMKASRECANRWVAAHRSVRIVMSEHEGNDLNDVAMRAAR